MSQLSNEEVRAFCPELLNVPLKMFPSDTERFADPFKKEIYDDEVRSYVKHGHAHLVGRQVPSCLALTSLGTRIAPKDVDTLLEMGFHLQKLQPGGSSWRTIPTREPTGSALSASQKTWFSDLMKSLDRGEESLLPPTEEEEEGYTSEESYDSDEDAESEANPWLTYRFVYEDPFRVNAAALMKNLTEETHLKVLSWPGGVKRLTDNIPKLCLKNPITGESLKRGMPFYKVRDPDILMNVLVRHTHWGKHLNKLSTPSADNKVSGWAQALRRRIKYFLQGKHDPIWTKEQIEVAYGRRGYKPRLTRQRTLRFLQILQTVDGLFIQGYLTDLTAGWTWSLYDNFILGAIHHLLGDEFLDGELNENFSMDTTTVYERLKAYRGQLKEAFLRGKTLPVGTGVNLVLANPVNLINRASEGIYRTQIGGIITQTRGCGTPPPFVVLKSKRKFLLTTSSAPEPLEKGQGSLIRLSIQQIMDEIPDHVFTGLTTKAGVNVTTSACFEEKRSDGGSTEYIRSIVREGRLGRPVKIIDLNTGQRESLQTLEEISVGGYIFWRCLEEVLGTPPELLREAKLVMIREPGKARTVTKARAALKVVLDLVNGICSHPLKKGVESSQSGMAQANHGWNFFTNLYGSWKDLAFDPVSREKTNNGPDSFLEEIEYAKLYVGFTDYSEATDKIDHNLARIVAEMWMTKCGIPKILRGIVHETCYKPRTIYFDGTGPLSKIGIPTETEGQRKITLVKGILMGDPLTKVVLHLLNIVARRLGGLLTEKSVLKLIPVVGESLIHRLTAHLASLI
jgi:hypothetical protein